MAEKIIYETCDLYLAAYLVAAGVKNEARTDLKTKRSYFIFPLEAVKELKANYFARKASIDALTYADNIKSLKSFCHISAA